jgi:hypothetical protein
MKAILEEEPYDIVASFSAEAQQVQNGYNVIEI